MLCGWDLLRLAEWNCLASCSGMKEPLLQCGAEAGANQAKCNAMELCCLHLPEALGE